MKLPERDGRPITLIDLVTHSAGSPANCRWEPKQGTLPVGHLGREAGLVDEPQPGRVEIELPLEPRLTRGADVGPVLLGRVRGFF